MMQPEPPETAAAEAREGGGAQGEGEVLAWARAVVLGLGDTARAMLDEARRGAREAYDEGWHRFEGKTKNRRKRRG